MTNTTLTIRYILTNTYYDLHYTASPYRLYALRQTAKKEILTGKYDRIVIFDEDRRVYGEYEKIAKKQI